MSYAISVNWMEEFKENPDKWNNLGRNILVEHCHHREGVSYKGYCDKCGVSEDSVEPMMNFAYPLETTPSEEDILKVVEDTSCTVMENTETDEYFLVLTGGGMDLSQDIGLAYIILERWIPQDLLIEINKQPCLSLGSKKWKKLAREVIKQLKHRELDAKICRKQWKENLKEFKIKENERMKK